MSPRLIPILCTLLLFPAAAPAQEPSPPFLTVTGNGTVTVDPDQANVRIGVETEEPAARDAQLEANRIASAILGAMRDLDIRPEAVQTSRLVLSPIYERPSPQQERREPRVIGYRATNTVSVELRDLTRIGPVLDAAIEAGANRIEGVEFGLQNDSEARRGALVAAVEDARMKAETIARALEVPLGPVLEIIDHGVSVPIPYRDAGGPMAMEAVATPVATGQISVSASLMIRYRIEVAAGPVPPR